MKKLAAIAAILAALTACSHPASETATSEPETAASEQQATTGTSIDPDKFEPKTETDSNAYLYDSPEMVTAWSETLAMSEQETINLGQALCDTTENAGVEYAAQLALKLGADESAAKEYDLIYFQAVKHLCPQFNDAFEAYQASQN